MSNTTTLKSRDVGRPRITGPGVSTTYNLVSHCRLPYEHGITIVPWCVMAAPLQAGGIVGRWRKCRFDGTPLSSNRSGYMRLSVRTGRAPVSTLTFKVASRSRVPLRRAIFKVAKISSLPSLSVTLLKFK